MSDLTDDLRDWASSGAIPRGLQRDLVAAAARIDALEAAIRKAVHEGLAVHSPDPADGRLCAICGAAGGSWPCDAELVARDLTNTLEDQT